MSTQQQRRARGHISIIQEQRFCLMTDAGQGLLLTLSQDADADIPQLERWRRAGASVLVEYRGEPALASGVARSVRPA
jgi:hypothetical protein